MLAQDKEQREYITDAQRNKLREAYTTIEEVYKDAGIEQEEFFAIKTTMDYLGRAIEMKNRDAR